MRFDLNMFYLFFFFFVYLFIERIIPPIKQVLAKEKMLIKKPSKLLKMISDQVGTGQEQVKMNITYSSKIKNENILK